MAEGRLTVGEPVTIGLAELLPERRGRGRLVRAGLAPPEAIKNPLEAI
jgi:hypothetical protein